MRSLVRAEFNDNSLVFLPEWLAMLRLRGVAVSYSNNPLYARGAKEPIPKTTLDAFGLDTFVGKLVCFACSKLPTQVGVLMVGADPFLASMCDVCGTSLDRCIKGSKCIMLPLARLSIVGCCLLLFLTNCIQKWLLLERPSCGF
jgi:hypothetical protein